MEEPQVETLIVDPRAVPRTSTPLSPTMLHYAQLDAFAMRVSDGYTYQKTITQTINGTAQTREIWTRPSLPSAHKRGRGQPSTRLATADLILATLEAYVNTARDLPLPRRLATKTPKDPRALRFVETMRMILGWRGNRLAVSVDAAKAPVEGLHDALAILALLVEDQLADDQDAWTHKQKWLMNRFDFNFQRRSGETIHDRAERMLPFFVSLRSHSRSLAHYGGVPWAIDFAARLGAIERRAIPEETFGVDEAMRMLARYDADAERDLQAQRIEYQLAFEEEEEQARRANRGNEKRFESPEVSESTLRDYTAALRKRKDLYQRILHLREYVEAWDREIEPLVAAEAVEPKPETEGRITARLSEAIEDEGYARSAEDADALRAAFDFERGS